MSDIVIRITELGKRFERVHEKPMLLRDLALLSSGRKRRIDEFWALRHVTFEVERGESLGVLGANGSGKSTLLTLIAGTSYPNEGSVSTRGRISTLLDLGAGFSQDMTGEENVIVNAGLLGVDLDVARRTMKDIVEFAELEDVIDSPIRHYSSGMLARLGFSIATHVSPDLLIIDEVLSVGDMHFQKKCLDRFTSMQERGVTVVFVSQAPAAVSAMCDRALWLKDGVLQRIGDAEEVAAEYAAAMSG